MNIVDIASLIFIALWLIIGIKKGLLHSILRLGAVAACLVITYLLYPYVMNLLDNFLGNSPRIGRAVFPAQFLLISVIVNGLLGRFIDTLGSSNALSPVNRMLGALLGAVQGAVYAAAFLIFLSAAVSPTSEIKRQIDEGVISGNLQKTIAMSYGSLDGLLRKTGINPLLEDIGQMFRG